MDEQQKLMKRAVEAYAEVCRKENGKKFFTWFEKEFGVKNYEKQYVDGFHSAIIDDFGFVWSKSTEMSVSVYGSCKFCGRGGVLQNSGIVVRTLEELGEFIDQEDDGTFYFNCGKHNSLESDAQNRSHTEEEIHIAVQVRIDKDKNGRKTQICNDLFQQ